MFSRIPGSGEGSASRASRTKIAIVALMLVTMVIPQAAVAGPLEEEIELIGSDTAGDDRFGYAVDLDAGTLVVGARQDDDAGTSSGTAYVFVGSSGLWTQQAKLTASDAQAGDLFGNSVAIDGDTILVGAPGEDGRANDTGAAYIFTRSSGTWTERAKLLPGSPSQGANFGWSVDLDGGTALIGEPDGAVNGEVIGSAYVFTGAGADWTQQARLAHTSGAVTPASQGVSVALDQDTAILGDDLAAGEDGTIQGAAYVFSRSGGTWQEVATLTAPNPGFNDQFGQSVSVDGSMAAVGAYFDDTLGDNAGAAYVYTDGSNGWALDARITASDGESHDEFARSVSLVGDRLLVGAPSTAGRTSETGVGYLFERTSNGWMELGKLQTSDGQFGDDLGFSTALEGGTVILSAPRADEAGTDSGEVDVFDLVPGRPLDPSATLASRDDTVDLSWNPPASVTYLTLDRYLIYRGDSSAGPFTQIAEVPATETSYTDGPLDQGTYHYVITARNEHGEGPASASVSQEISPPGAPQGVAVSGSDDTATLTWEAPPPDTYGTLEAYHIKRATQSGGPYTEIAEVEPSTTRYTDSGLSQGTYHYVITAENAVGQGPASQEVTQRITPPGAPQDLTATPVGQNVELDWTPPDPSTYGELTAYRVYRSSEGQDGPYTKIAQVHPDQTSYTDHDLDSGTYRYRVTAVNAVGEGQASDSASATVQAPPPAVESQADGLQDDGGTGGDASDDPTDPTPLPTGGQIHTFTGTLIPGIDTLDAYGQTLSVTQTSQLCYEIDPQPTLDIRLRLLDPNLSPVAVSDTGGLGATETVCAGTPSGPSLDQGQWVLAVETVGLAQTQGSNPLLNPTIGLFDYFGERRCDPEC